MSGQETMHLEMSMREVMTLIRQINVDKGVQDLRFDLRADSIKEILSIRIGYNRKFTWTVWLSWNTLITLRSYGIAVINE